MNITATIRFTFLVLFLHSIHALSQPAGQQNNMNSWSHNSKNCHHILSNSFQCNWKFITFKGTLEGTVVTYQAVKKDPNASGSASVAIIKTQKDTVRVLLFSYGNHKPGDKVKITPAKEPENDVFVPLDRDYFLAEEKSGHKPAFRINEYDKKVMKTAWGSIAGE